MSSTTAKLGILLRVAIPAVVAWVLFHAHVKWGGGPGRGEALEWMQMGSLALIAPMAWFVTTAERMSPALEACVPKNRVLALLVSPFLPGGGRGILLLLLSFGLRDVIALSYSQLNGNAPIVDMQVIRRMLVLDGAIFIFLALPSALTALWTANRWARISGFVAIVATAGVILDAPAWLPYWHGLPSWLRWWVPESSFPQLLIPTFDYRGKLSWGNWEDTKRLVKVLLSVGCIATLALNLPRIFNGLREVWKASAAREQDSA